MVNDINMNKLILHLFLVSDKDRKIPIGILSKGVNMAIPGKPKLLRNLTTQRFQPVKTRFCLFGNNRLNERLINSPKKVKKKTPKIPPPTVLI